MVVRFFGRCRHTAIGPRVKMENWGQSENCSVGWPRSWKRQKVVFLLLGVFLFFASCIAYKVYIHTKESHHFPFLVSYYFSHYRFRGSARRMRVDQSFPSLLKSTIKQSLNRRRRSQAVERHEERVDERILFESSGVKAASDAIWRSWVRWWRAEVAPGSDGGH